MGSHHVLHVSMRFCLFFMFLLRSLFLLPKSTWFFHVLPSSLHVFLLSAGLSPCSLCVLYVSAWFSPHSPAGCNSVIYVWFAGHFLFLPSSNRTAAGENAWLVSPHLPPTTGTCLRFWAYRQSSCKETSYHQLDCLTGTWSSDIWLKSSLCCSRLQAERVEVVRR